MTFVAHVCPYLRKYYKSYLTRTAPSRNEPDPVHLETILCENRSD